MVPIIAFKTRNRPLSFMKYSGSEKWEYTKSLYAYLTRYPTSNKRFFDVQRKLHALGIQKKGIVLPPVQKQVALLPSGKRDPFHIMHRMIERHITDDDLRSFMQNARCMIVQWGGQRQMFISNRGISVIHKEGDIWKFKTAWDYHDFDTETDTIMEVLNNAGL